LIHPAPIEVGIQVKISSPFALTRKKFPSFGGIFDFFVGADGITPGTG